MVRRCPRKPPLSRAPRNPHRHSVRDLRATLVRECAALTATRCVPAALLLRHPPSNSCRGSATTGGKAPLENAHLRLGRHRNLLPMRHPKQVGLPRRGHLALASAATGSEERRLKARERQGRGAELLQLFVRHTRTVTVEVDAADDVGALLVAVSHKAGVPREVAWLAFGGRRLEAGRPLSSVGLSAGSTVHLVVRGRGGGCASSTRRKEDSSGTSVEAIVPDILGQTERNRSPVTLGRGGRGKHDESDTVAAIVAAPPVKEPEVERAGDDAVVEPAEAVTLPIELFRALTAFDDRLVKALEERVIRLVHSAWLLAQPAGFKMPYRQQLEEQEHNGASPLVRPEEAAALIRRGNRSVGAVTQ